MNLKVNPEKKQLPGSLLNVDETWKMSSNSQKGERAPGK